MINLTKTHPIASAEFRILLPKSFTSQIFLLDTPVTRLRSHLQVPHRTAAVSRQIDWLLLCPSEPLRPLQRLSESV